MRSVFGGPVAMFLLPWLGFVLLTILVVVLIVLGAAHHPAWILLAGLAVMAWQYVRRRLPPLQT